MNISGIHHITAVASDPQQNLEFYVKVLGLRFIKRTVNFDDPGTYHFYYGDEVGTPGSILTFFPWPGAIKGKRGAGFVTSIAFKVPIDAIKFWEQRFTEFKINIIGKQQRFGDSVLQFEDPDGLILEIVECSESKSNQYWSAGGIGQNFALRGFHSVTITTKKIIQSSNLLEHIFGFKKLAVESEASNRIRFTSSNSDIIDLIDDSNSEFGELGAGMAHHLALRANNANEQQAWKDKLDSHGFAVTEIKDRNYFQSIYFRERSGVLFEIATDGPGFLVDEAVSSLGAGLKLPLKYEVYREDLYQRLPGLKVPTPNSSDLSLHAHLFETCGSVISENTFLLLHGTGGDEKSMLSLARMISDNANLLSPKGNVLEGRQNRFFKRLAEGIFDQEDLRYRSLQLNLWLAAAQKNYGFKIENLTALGFSNGANIAAAMLLLGKASFKQAILICAMPPFSSYDSVDLSSHRILLIAGNQDSIVPLQESRRLASMLEGAGANVQLEIFDCGHILTNEGIEAIKNWMSY